MFRRLTLAALAAPVLLRPARAQGPAEQEEAAARHEVQARMLGDMAYALAIAQLGERLAANPGLKRFAGLEAEEQTAAAAARGMAGLRLPMPELMAEERRQTMMRLRDMSGITFDRLFLREQMVGHQELLQLHQAALRSPASREEAMLATVAVPAIRSHMVLLEGIERTMRG
jgi:hypothetical protein